ncbi:hypothetical protein [Terrarubrum flagellatum]|uniref:hypothetical protein n=1 Tax=Terrirubrum flagellatum TaxID=2895980 RepID=UPI0031451339
MATARTTIFIVALGFFAIVTLCTWLIAVRIHLQNPNIPRRAIFWALADPFYAAVRYGVRLKHLNYVEDVVSLQQLKKFRLGYIVIWITLCIALVTTSLLAGKAGS